MTARRRLPGTSWRFQAHHATTKRGGAYGPPIDDSSDNHPPSVFDELVVDRWLHIEQMDTNLWWMSVAGIVIFVQVDRDGRPTSVMTHAPGNYDHAIDGVEYAGDLTPHTNQGDQ